MKYLPKTPTLSITKNIKTFIYITGILMISAAFLVPYLRISSRKRRIWRLSQAMMASLMQ